jgi:hypothetical protein
MDLDLPTLSNPPSWEHTHTAAQHTKTKSTFVSIKNWQNLATSPFLFKKIRERVQQTHFGQ